MTKHERLLTGSESMDLFEDFENVKNEMWEKCTQKELCREDLVCSLEFPCDKLLKLLEHLPISYEES